MLMTMEEQSTSITKENPQSKTQNSQTTKQMTTTEEQYIAKRTLKYTTPYLKTIKQITHGPHLLHKEEQYTVEQ